MPAMLTADGRHDVIVVGAGQAGLALGFHLARHHSDFLLLDASTDIGHSWRTRWDSLRLFTPAQYDGLPGLPFPAPADTHPGKDDVADYLQRYAARFSLPVRLNCPAQRVHREDDGTYAIATPTGVLRSKQVVVATGPFQTPFVPAFAEQLDPSVRQLHSAGYRNPAQLPAGGRVLVVGAANSGLQIATELVARCRLSVAAGSTPTQLPQRIAGRDVFTWLRGAGFFTVPADSGVGRRLRARGDLIIGNRVRTLRRRGISFRPRLIGITDRVARFADGSQLEVDAVVWATGYRPDYSWLHVPGVFDGDGAIRHTGGVSEVPGLYFLGLPWQRTRGSALLGFVGVDAAALADRLAGDVLASPTVRPSWLEAAR